MYAGLTDGVETGARPIGRDPTSTSKLQSNTLPQAQRYPPRLQLSHPYSSVVLPETSSHYLGFDLTFSNRDGRSSPPSARFPSFDPPRRVWPGGRVDPSFCIAEATRRQPIPFSVTFGFLGSGWLPWIGTTHSPRVLLSNERLEIGTAYHTLLYIYTPVELQLTLQSLPYPVVNLSRRGPGAKHQGQSATDLPVPILRC